MSIVSHGAFGEVSKYEITQHGYVARDNEGPSTGYLEVLEIKKEKRGKASIVIHKYDTQKGSVYTTWDTLGHAQSAFKTSKVDCVTSPACEKLPGFIGWTLVAGKENPWFYEK